MRRLSARAGKSAASGRPLSESPRVADIASRYARRAPSGLGRGERPLEGIAQQVELWPLDGESRREDDVRAREADHRAALVGLAVHAGELRGADREARARRLV